jgi:hypothetical protein
MADLYFPQLTSGALAQFPIHKKRTERTVTNVLADGSLILDPDPAAGRLMWSLSYSGLSIVEMNQLQALFQACNGPLRGFTFIDPTDNMFSSSGDLTAAVWQNEASMTISGGAADPFGGTGAFVVTNNSQLEQELTQTIAVPAGYMYCFSIYVLSAEVGTIGLLRQGAADEVMSAVSTGPTWSRAISQGNLNDSGTTLTAGISLQPGQQITVFGPQLEAQWAPSSLRLTGESGGVYADAHWLDTDLAVAPTGPNLFSTIVNIETVL